ncbi:MAG TPA: aminotransferase class III-fold pyridoxal phosphate-dependent enzyme [Nannocystis sp.]
MSPIFYTWTAQRHAHPLTVDAAEGARFRTVEHGWLWDLESQTYNVSAGHNVAPIQERMIAQIRELPAAGPNMRLPVRDRLAAELCARTGLARVFLATGGAEAVENAIKIARLYTGRSKIVTRRNSYHGATLTTLAVAGDPRRAPFAAHLPPAIHIDDPYPIPPGTPSAWVRSLHDVLEREDPATIAAILLEGFTGTNGMQHPPPDFWPAVREACDRHGILLIDDEVFSGFGRTGKWFARDHWGVQPDIMVLGKALTSGYAPLSAVVVSAAVAAHFDDNKLWCGLTHYAHPVGCAAALGALEVYDRERLPERAALTGAALGERLSDLSQRTCCNGAIRDVRGLGLMRCVEFDRPVAPLARDLLHRGAYAPFRDNLLFLCPPLCLTLEEAHQIADLLEAAIADFLAA